MFRENDIWVNDEARWRRGTLEPAIRTCRKSRAEFRRVADSFLEICRHDPQRNTLPRASRVRSSASDCMFAAIGPEWIASRCPFPLTETPSMRMAFE